MKMIVKKYSYDDVLIVPQYSEIIPKDVDTSCNLTSRIKLNIPIITSPMDTVTESKMAIKIAQLGGAGFIHKNMPLEEQIVNIKEVKKVKPTKGATVGIDKKLFVGISISHSISDDDLKKLIKAGADALILDSAHGHSKNIIDKIKNIKKKFKDVQLIAGNVATTKAAKELSSAGVDAIRVGIGPGAICTTRVVTGIGVPQLSAIIDAKEGVKGTKTKIIADGGIKTSGDMVKALAAGADVVMIGSLAAGTSETPGEKIWIDGIAYKTYRGMGSIAAMKRGSNDRYRQPDVKDPEKLVPEGVEGLVLFKGHIEDNIYQYVGGIKSGLGYVGAANISELHKKAVFVEITNSGLNESHPHSLNSFEKTINYGGK